MEHTFKIEKELKITTENIVDCVLSCEAGGFDYWGELCSDEKDYEAARQRLTEREKADMKPCYEDVLAEILESGGKLTDIMQSSGSAGLPNDSLEEESSIRQGCTYFAHLLSKGKSLDCDLDCIIQAYNYGSGFLDYAAKFSGVYSTELAEKFAEKQSGGNTIQYDNPMAVQENGGWRYAYGNMFYARLVKQYLIE